MEIKNRKGFVYTLEAIIASMLLLATATVIIPELGDVQSENTEIQDRLRSSMEMLDRTGELRDIITVEELEGDIEPYIPEGYSYNVLLKEADTQKISIDINSLTSGVFRQRSITNAQNDWNQGWFNKTSADREDTSDNLGDTYSTERAPGLVGYWPLDNTSGSVRDRSGYGNDGINNRSTRGVSGVFGTKAFRFNHHDNEYVNISGSTPEELDFSDETSFAVSAWVKWAGSESDDSQWIYSTGSEGIGNRHTYLGINRNNYFVFGYDADGGSKGGYWEGTFTNLDELDKNEWNHIVGTSDGTTIELYIDGEQVSSDSVSVSSPDDAEGPAYIGQFPTEENAWNGEIDEVMAFNRSLSEEGIKELYHRESFTDLGLGYRNSTEGELAGYWRFDKTSGSITDYSSNGNSASNSGAERGTEGVFSTNGVNLSAGDSLTISNTEEISEAFSTNELTIAFWIKHTKDTSGWNTILQWDAVNGTGAEHSIRTEMRGANNRSIYTRFVAEDSECGLVSDGGFWARDADMNHEPGEWNLYTVTYDGETIREYSNGQVQETNPISCDLADISGDIDIIGLPNSQLMDELQFYDRALSTEQVKNLYLNGHQESFTGNYSQNFTLPEGEVPESIQVNSRNIDNSGNVSWAKIFTNTGENEEIRLDSGDVNRNYSLGFSNETEEVSVEFNFSTNNETPAKSPIIDNFRIWASDSAEKSYYVDKDGSVSTQLHLSNAEDLNVSFNQERLLTDYSGEGYEFRNLPDNEGHLKFSGIAEGTATIRNQVIKGENPNVDDVKNVNYIINEDGEKEVTVSLWQ